MGFGLGIGLVVELRIWLGLGLVTDTAYVTISDDSINRNFDTIRFDSIYRIESNRIVKKISNFSIYRDI